MKISSQTRPVEKKFLSHSSKLSFSGIKKNEDTFIKPDTSTIEINWKSVRENERKHQIISGIGIGLLLLALMPVPGFILLVIPGALTFLIGDLMDPFGFLRTTFPKVFKKEKDLV
jgi:hypothetical protein